MGLGSTNKTAAELLGVPAPARNARDRLLNKAIDLFYEHGFNAIGLDRVLDEVGVTKTTFYKHFESKEELMVAAIVQRDAWETQAWSNAVKKVAGDDLRAQLLAVFEVLDIWFNDPTFGGCIFLNAAVEFPNPYDPVHQAAAAYKVRVRDRYCELAKAAGATDPEQFADRYAMLLEGTLVMRHVHHRNDAAKLAKGMAEQLVEEFIPLRRGRSSPRQGQRRHRTKQPPVQA